MKIIVVGTGVVQHDNAKYVQDQVIELSDEDGARLIGIGVARKAPDTFPVSEGEPVVRKEITEEEKVTPSAAQIAEAEKAAKEPELKPEDQFAKSEIATNPVTAGEVDKIVEIDRAIPKGAFKK